MMAQSTSECMLFGEADALHLGDSLYTNALHYVRLRHYGDVWLSLVPISNTDKLSATYLAWPQPVLSLFMFSLQMLSFQSWTLLGS